MPVFEPAPFLLDASLAAAHDLGILSALVSPHTPASLAAALDLPSSHRLRALLDVLVALGVLSRRGDLFATAAAATAARPSVPPSGWGLLADVIRLDRPLPIPDEAAYHRHLALAGAATAQELAPLLPAGSLLDLGCGAGTYTAAFLSAHAASSATLVDTPRVLSLARSHLAAFGPRVHFVAGDARTAPLGSDHAAALLANVLHLHPPPICAELCLAAARAVAPGGLVAILDLHLQDDRSGPLASLLFALNMALYTPAGDVHEPSRIRAWLAQAGLVDISVHPLTSSPDSLLVLGRRPPAAELAISTQLAASLAATGATAFPPLLQRSLARAIALSPTSELSAALVRHYTDSMPRARVALLSRQGEPAASFFHTPLDWSLLPRLSAALDRLHDVLASADLDLVSATGASSSAAFRSRTPTLAALYERTHYGGAMPLLYGLPADLAYFRARADELGLHAAIDRYLTAPLVHELCHLSPSRVGLSPLHLDECVAGWLGVHVHPELAYPAPDHDDAIFAAPWLSQIGQALARAFGVRALLRAHAGVAALPLPFTDAAARLGWEDWCARRTLHFLSDTLDPDPWVNLALAAGANLPLSSFSLASLSRLPPTAFAALPADPAFDLAIVADGLRAMCLENTRIAGSFRTRTSLPGPIAVSAATGHLSCTPRGDALSVAPRYWLPPAVCAALSAAGLATCELQLHSLSAIPDAASALCAAAPATCAGFSFRGSPAPVRS